MGRTKRSIGKRILAAVIAIMLIVTMIPTEQLQTHAQTTQSTSLLDIPDSDYTIAGYEGEYDGVAHGVSVQVAEGYTVQYSEDGATYGKEAPVITNAGEKSVYVQISKEGYKTVSKEVALKVLQADRTDFKFKEAAPKDLEYKSGLTFENTATSTLETTTVSYKSSDDTVATVDADGKVTFLKVGSVTITATMAASTNYKASTADYSITVYKAPRTFGFETTSSAENPITVTYGEQQKGLEPNEYLNKAVNAEDDVQITYAITKQQRDEKDLEAGDAVATIDNTTGKVSILTAGTIEVTATVEAGTNHKEASASYWLKINRAKQTGFAFEPELPEEIIYGTVWSVDITAKGGQSEGAISYTLEQEDIGVLKDSDTADKKLQILKPGTITVSAKKAQDNRYEEILIDHEIDIQVQALEQWYTMSEEKNDSGWYTSNVSILPREGYGIKIESDFKPGDHDDWPTNTIDFTEEKAYPEYRFYVRKNTQGAISGVQSEVIRIDKTAPTCEIEYSEPIKILEIWEKITFGFYKAPMTVTVTVSDTTSGVDKIEYSKNGQDYVSMDVKEAKDVDGKQVFEFKISPEYKGSVDVIAYDIAGNTTAKTGDKIIVVDSISPEMTVKYIEADGIVDNHYYYKKDIKVELEVIEANFYKENVEVTVTKDGKTFEHEDLTWTKDEATENTYKGTFTIYAPEDNTGDGDYVITINCKDYSGNAIEEYVSAIHTIDTTKPIITVEYENKNVINTFEKDQQERDYFDDVQTATITIEEHNFDEKEVEILIDALDVTGKKVSDTYTENKWETVAGKKDSHKKTITFSGDANYEFNVEYTDFAGNKADGHTKHFTVDKTAPENLTVDYSTPILDTILEAISFGFYNAKVKVTLSAEDQTSEIHEFLYSYVNAKGVSKVNAELINQAISESEVVQEGRKATVIFEIPKDVLENTNQFNGTVTFTATNRAGKASNEHKEEKRIVVDNIAPTAKVTYNEATNVVGDISYYNGNIKATVTINEANFYASDVRVMVSKDGGAATAVTPKWTHTSVDVHVGTFTLTGDGDYIVTIDYADKSANKMTTYTSKQMTIDTKIEAPTYTINGVAKKEVGGAYKGDATVGFSYADQNFDTKTIRLTRTRFDKVEDVTDTFIKVSDNDKGGSGTFTIPSEVENDGIYVLTIGMTDKAKHTIESQMQFTINRFGSVYKYSDELVGLIKDGGQYVTSVKENLVITEYNAERLMAGSLQILITRDGEAIDVDYTTSPATIDGQVGIGASGWYQYVYTIKASNFEKDGVYKISLSSKYATLDSAENVSTSVPENSINEQGEKIVDTMNFTVDSTAPEIRNIVNLNKQIADKDQIVDGKLNVKYTIVDVGGLKTIEIIVNGETIQTLTQKEIAENAYNFTGSFELEEQDGTKAHKVRIKATDLAGNVIDTDSKDFQKEHSKDNENSTYVFFNEVTVSRNFFVRWYANKPLFWGSIGGVIVFAAAICFIITTKKKKNEEGK